LYTLDSLDPEAIKDILEKIKDIEKTLVIPISKSGTTQETQLLSHTLKQLFGASWQRHFLWLSDPTAFEKLDSLGWQGVSKLAIQFDEDTDIGGRFSSPHTLIFFLPLFILLNKDFQALENIYNAYVSLQGAIRAQAYALAERYKDAKQAYFFPTIAGGFNERLSSWIVQLFQESLGSKDSRLAVKTRCAEEKNDLFKPLELKIEIDNPVVSLIAKMYFFEVFIAFYSAFKKINFVDQDFVEKYKDQMRKLKEQTVSDIPMADIAEIIAQVKDKIKPAHKFIEVVLYFYADKKTIIKINKLFAKNFKGKTIFVFVGSDWNHHSYQAAFGEKYTFYVLLPMHSYNAQVNRIEQAMLNKNIETLKLISYATYLTLKDKAVLFSLQKN
jgi:hypothetical protein